MSRACVALVLLVGLLLTACGKNPTTSRYQIERDMLRAERTERQMQVRSNTPPTPEQARGALKAYENLLARNPMPTLSSSRDTLAIRQIGRIRAQAEMRVVQLQRFLGDTTAVRRILEGGAKTYAWDTGISLAFRRAEIEEAITRGDGPKAVRLYQQLAADLPARGSSGRPNTEVLEAPIRAADILNQMGQQDAAYAELDRAEVYYRELIGDSPKDLTAAWCWLQIAETARRRGNLDGAANALTQARQAAVSDSSLDSNLLLSLGVLQQEGKKDYPTAIAHFRDLRRSFPKRDDLCAESLWREAACLGEMKRTDEALAVIDNLESAYPRDRQNVARGRLIAARILAEGGRWPEAQTKYRSLQADFPGSAEALGAPFEVATHYAQQGETEAVRTTLGRAVDDFRKISEDPTLAEETRRSSAAMTVAALIRLERWPDAAAEMVSNVKRFPRDPRNPVQLIQAASIYKDRLGDPAKAAELLEQVASAYPSSPLAPNAREEAKRLRGR